VRAEREGIADESAHDGPGGAILQGCVRHAGSPSGEIAFDIGAADKAAAGLAENLLQRNIFSGILHRNPVALLGDDRGLLFSDCNQFSSNI